MQEMASLASLTSGDVMSSRRVLAACLVTIIAMGAGLPSQARAAEVSSVQVDQVLSALAEVIKDRAKRVASNTVVRKLSGQLCSHEAWTLNPATRTLLQEKDQTPQTPPGALTLWLGGRKSCSAGEVECDSDDVFVRSCALLQGEHLQLTDPHLLKTLSQETVAFAVRLSAHRMSSKQYEELKMPGLARYLHGVMEALARKDRDLDDILTPTLELADDLSPKLAGTVLENVGDSPETWVLLESIEKSVTAGCGAAAPAGTICADLNDPKLRENWVPVGLFQRGTPSPKRAEGLVLQTACTNYLKTANFRSKRFRELFLDNAADGKPAPLSDFTKKACDGPGAADCQRNWLLLRFAPALYKATCHAYTPDSRRDLRNLTYLLRDQPMGRDNLGGLTAGDAKTLSIYDATFKMLGADGPPPGALALVQAVDKGAMPSLADRAVIEKLSVPQREYLRIQYPKAAVFDLQEVPREELASGLRTLVLAVRARREDPAGARAWLNQLRTDITKAMDPGQSPRFLNLAYLENESDSLNWVTRSQYSVHVQALRDSIKDMLALPHWELLSSQRRTQQGAAQAQKAIAALLRVFQKVADARELPTSVEQSLPRLGDIMEALADLTVALTANPETTDKKMLEDLSDALRLSSTVMNLAGERDWVGIALNTTQVLRTRFNAGPEVMGRSFSFLRVLMSMYQAQSVDEAKGIFAATLEEEASREQRYGALSVDIAALVAVRGGGQFSSQRKTAELDAKNTSAAFGGLFVPVGFQLTYKGIGGLVYPVDVGTYLLATSEKDDKPRWPDAVRLGASVYGRPWSSVPVVFGAGSDFRPAFEDRTETRVFGFAALELPLYMLQ